MPKGGRRPGAGRPKGTTGIQQAETLSKVEARECVRQVVMRHLDRMMRSQIAHAIGIGHLFIRDKSGKFSRVENDEQATKLLTEGTEGQDYWIFTKDPSTQAFTDLLNRALDKPKEQEQEIAVRGSVDVVGILKARASRRKLENP